MRQKKTTTERKASKERPETILMHKIRTREISNVVITNRPLAAVILHQAFSFPG